MFIWTHLSGSFIERSNWFVCLLWRKLSLCVLVFCWMFFVNPLSHWYLAPLLSWLLSEVHRFVFKNFLSNIWLFPSVAKGCSSPRPQAITKTLSLVFCYDFYTFRLYISSRAHLKVLFVYGDRKGLNFLSCVNIKKILSFFLVKLWLFSIELP